jgi:hypothetical protein
VLNVPAEIMTSFLVSAVPVLSLAVGYLISGESFTYQVHLQKRK